MGLAGAGVGLHGPGSSSRLHALARLGAGQVGDPRGSEVSPQPLPGLLTSWLLSPGDTQFL